LHLDDHLLAGDPAEAVAVHEDAWPEVRRATVARVQDAAQRLAQHDRYRSPAARKRRRTCMLRLVTDEASRAWAAGMDALSSAALLGTVAEDTVVGTHDRTPDALAILAAVVDGTRISVTARPSDVRVHAPFG